MKAYYQGFITFTFLIAIASAFTTLILTSLPKTIVNKNGNPFIDHPLAQLSKNEVFTPQIQKYEVPSIQYTDVNGKFTFRYPQINGIDSNIQDSREQLWMQDMVSISGADQTSDNTLSFKFLIQTTSVNHESSLEDYIEKYPLQNRYIAALDSEALTPRRYKNNNLDGYIADRGGHPNITVVVKHTDTIYEFILFGYHVTVSPHPYIGGWRYPGIDEQEIFHSILSTFEFTDDISPTLYDDGHLRFVYPKTYQLGKSRSLNNQYFSIYGNDDRGPSFHIYSSPPRSAETESLANLDYYVEHYLVGSTAGYADYSPVRIQRNKATISAMQGYEYRYHLSKPNELGYDTVTWVFLSNSHEALRITLLGNPDQFQELLNSLVVQYPD